MPNDTHCAICGAPLTETDAEPAPEGATLRYHTDFALCLRATLADLARATAVMRACVGVEDKQGGIECTS